MVDTKDPMTPTMAWIRSDLMEDPRVHKRGALGMRAGRRGGTGEETGHHQPPPPQNSLTRLSLSSYEIWTSWSSYSWTKVTYSSHLGPILSSLGIDVYCVDLLGWGYTQLDPSVLSYSARAKVEALRGLWEVVGGNGEVVVGGASLGGAAVIEYAADVLRRGDDNDYGIGGDFVRGTVLIDAQGFVDGIGPMSYLPAPIARLGIRVLKSEPLRSSANRMSYYDVESYATEDALRVGRLHTLREGWEDGMLSFMRSGGFRPREKVPTIGVPTLVLWGRQDGILDGEEYANMFVNGMPDATLRWIEECGHVPHLEQPETTARHIADFLMSEGARPSRRGGSTSSASRKRASATGGNILEGIFRFLN
ncbi:hypothetical protein ACHAW5_010510 [Stephanodiscus triporus]|uniref:AB hydrolase-1 domain-containing protein n=1 Tax=Stephanodiscus triporus TaxID=2934178 RepID=A0ABD3QWW3_9STRA